MFEKPKFKRRQKPKVIKIQMQDRKECYVCHCVTDLEDHHVFGGANRPLSERYGLKVWLCYKDHQGDQGIHYNRPLRKQIQETAKQKFISIYGEQEFLRIFKGVQSFDTSETCKLGRPGNAGGIGTV
jgi:hypothetical protein